MARWRYMTAEEVDRVFTDEPKKMPGDEVRDIFEVIDGWVSPQRGEMALDIAKKAPKGWFVRLLDEEIPEFTYRVNELSVRVNGEVATLKSGTLVAFLPPNYRELVDAA